MGTDPELLNFSIPVVRIQGSKNVQCTFQLSNRILVIRENPYKSTAEGPVIRVASYNVHKCRGLDRRTRPQRIAEVLAELDADVIALQEVLSIPGGSPEEDQARFIADFLGGYAVHFGENRSLRGGRYGNATLTRVPAPFTRNYDLTWKHRERRGCLRTDIECSQGVLHVFNVHLGTSFFERRHQARRLVGGILETKDLPGPALIVGDFNEWTRGLASRLMSQRYCSIDLRTQLRRRRTYPGLVPILHLDHFYFDQRLRLKCFSLHRTRQALIASDHLPLLAEFELL
jgi:endonuclease/exonuclease/phosphatase family metal-dependent hydrolase